METIFGSRKKEDLDACRFKHVSPNLRVQTLPRTNYSHVSKKICHKFNTHRELASYWHFESLHSMNHISVLIFLTSSLRFRVNLFYFLVNARQGSNTQDPHLIWIHHGPILNQTSLFASLIWATSCMKQESRSSDVRYQRNF